MFSRLRKKRAEHEIHQEHCTALCCAKRGQRMSVVRFGGDAQEAARLRDIGVREGVTVTVLRDGDPLLVKVDDARFGIGRAAAMSVLCRFCEETPLVQKTLDMLQPGDQAVIKELQGEPETTERLMEMGLVAGTPLKVLKFAPLGDPIEVVIRGYHLTLRRTEAAGILVEI